MKRYVYEYIPKFYLGFEKDQLSSAGLYGTYGGGIDDVNFSQSGFFGLYSGMFAI